MISVKTSPLKYLADTLNELEKRSCEILFVTQSDETYTIIYRTTSSKGC